MLAGIRVVEFATYVAAPGACGLLADWGADVIKVEPPTGDPMRLFFASAGRDDARNAVFDTDNRGKRSIVLDPSDPADAEALRTLAASADVFVTNARPASLRKAGLDWESLSRRAPRLIHASLTGFGATGPDADKPGFDITAFWSRSGLCSLATAKGGDPVPLRTGIGDHTAALALVAGITTALFERERTGQGREVSTSLLRTGIYAAASDHATQLQAGKLASTKARADTVNPLNNFFRAGDGRWLVIVPRQGTGDWPRIVRAVAREGLLDDPRFGSIKDRRANGPALVDVLDEAFGAMTLAEAGAALDREGVIWGPVQSVAEAASDPQALAAGCFVDVALAEGGSHRVPNGPVDFGERASSLRAAPALGEHGDAIRAEIAKDGAALVA